MKRKSYNIFIDAKGSNSKYISIHIHYVYHHQKKLLRSNIHTQSFCYEQIIPPPSFHYGTLWCICTCRHQNDQFAFGSNSKRSIALRSFSLYKILNFVKRFYKFVLVLWVSVWFASSFLNHLIILTIWCSFILSWLFHGGEFIFIKLKFYLLSINFWRKIVAFRCY